MWTTLDAVFDRGGRPETVGVGDARWQRPEERAGDDTAISVGGVLKVIGWFILLGIVIYAIAS